MENPIYYKLKKLTKTQLQEIYKKIFNKNTMKNKSNIIDSLIKPLKKKYKMDIELKDLTKYSISNKYNDSINFCKNFQITPDINIQNIFIDKNTQQYFYKIGTKNIHLYPQDIIGQGSHGNITLLSDNDNVYNIALKKIDKQFENQFNYNSIIIDNEIPIIEEIQKKKISCDLISAKLIHETYKSWYIIMPAYSSYTLRSFIGKLNNIEIINIAIELGNAYKCLLKYEMYYTDSKPSQVLCKCTSKNNFKITLGDLGSISHYGEECLQTYPFPPQEYYNNFYKDAENASEKVVVWGFIIMLLMLINKNISNLIDYYLSWETMKINNYKNTVETFYIAIQRELIGNPLKDFFETFLGIKKNLYTLINEGEYTMKNVLDYLTGYPFIIKFYNKIIPKEQLMDLENLSLECWNTKGDFNNTVYCIYINMKIVSYGILDKQNTLWSLCTTKNARGKGYAKKIIDEMFKDTCKKNKNTMYLFVNEKSPKDWYLKLGFEYVSLSESEQKKYTKNIQKMYKKCYDK
mgnify:CR=1 FL=1